MKPKATVTEALGLPPMEDYMCEQEKNTDSLYDIDSNDDYNDISLEEAQRALQKLKEMRMQLKDIPDITKRKDHLDRLANLAERKFEDIFDRAFNCEDRFASEMLNSANAMLKMALDAHSKVIESDIKLVDLQLKKDKMEIELNMKPKSTTPETDQNAIDGEKVVYRTRNEMLGAMKGNK